MFAGQRLITVPQQPASSRLFAFDPGSRGFTLIELMVVLVIVGVILSFVALSTGGDSRAEEMEREARRLVVLLELASQEAVMRSEQLAVRFGEDEYEFMTLHDNQWAPLSDERPLRPRQLPKGIELRLELQDNPPPGLTAEDSDLPQVFLLSSGEMTPFILTFSAEGSEQKFHINASLLGQLELE
jgi:general secretion pathway protein H